MRARSSAPRTAPARSADRTTPPTPASLPRQGRHSVRSRSRRPGNSSAGAGSGSNVLANRFSPQTRQPGGIFQPTWACRLATQTARRMAAPVDGTGVEVVRVHRRLLAVHLGRDHHLLPFKAAHIGQHAVVVGRARRPGQMIGARVAHTVGELPEHAARRQDLLHRAVVKQLPAQPLAVGQDGIAPLIVRLVGIQVWRQHHLADAGRSACGCRRRRARSSRP